ncbi:uncharacterized protein LOC130795833 [Actinidia eriantha]|uniref:uncharacterized protein LOC130795833 n=1 Tax=Actinidia eriantha TaxID=165200 RepID=UPI0025892F88|nr:uncharacterized protein LOC130795833 [Actinidia eriantha]
MRCKKHLTDLSSSVGVCSSCLRERLFALIQAQAQQVQEDCRKSDPHTPPSLAFPRSASPYICRRKSEMAACNHHHTLSDQLFYSTPQIGPTHSIAAENSYAKKKSKFSLISKLFRSKSKKIDSDHTISNSSNTCPVSTSPPSWFSYMLSVADQQKKQSAAGFGRKTGKIRDRGMSPVRVSDYGEDEECCDGSSGSSSEKTPQKATPQVRRGSGRPSHARNMSGLKFCLSPLVRASPHRMPETAFSGDIRVPAKPHLSTAAAFCANRSRKLADFGRFNPNY